MLTELEYANIDGQSLKIEVRSPEIKTDKPSPAVVVIFGGGWMSSTKDRESYYYDALVAAGLTVFSPEYRFASEKARWPACLNDVRAAVKWVVAHAKEYGSDGTRIGISGYSAGGQLAAHAAMVDPIPQIAAVALISTPTDFVYDNFRRGGEPGPSAKALFGKEKFDEELLEIYWRLSPINYVRPGLPPFYLVNGTADKTVPHALSEHMHQRLSDVGIKSDLYSIKDAPHRISDWPQFDDKWAERLAGWFVRTLGA